MKKKITRLTLLVLSIVALLAFAGCELTGTDSFDSLTTDSRKGKPQTVTTNVTTPPPVYEGTEGSELDLDVEDYIETFYAAEDVVFTSYAEPFEFTPYAIVEFTPYDPIVFSPYAEPFEFTPYSSVDFTSYSPELFFYYDEDEKVFVSENDPLATHKITGFDTTGYNTTGFNTTGYDTTGFNTIGYNTVGERVVGWESSEYGLWAGQDNDAGTVYISNDNENFYITIDTNSSSDLQEVHIYVYEDESALPDKRPAPGQAPYVEQNIYADSVTVTIPISDLINLEDYYFAIHAALVDDAVGSDDGTSLAGETAYAAGDDTPDYNGKGAWYYVVGYNLNAIIEYITEDVYEDVDVDVQEDVYADVHEEVIVEYEIIVDPELPEGAETAWAYSPQFSNDFLDLGFNRWGWTNGPLTSSGSFIMYAGAGQSDITKGTQVAHVAVSYNSYSKEISVYILEMPWSGYSLHETHLYIGEVLLPLGNNGNPTVAPGQFPYSHDDRSEFVPLPWAVPTTDGYKIPWDGGPFYLALHATAIPNN